jgi:hypothetical protein
LTDGRPPKKKGNPIITRYPPPPGYRGPAQPQGQFGATQYPNQFQPPQPGYGQAPPAPSAYPHQAFTAPPTPVYSPQGYSPAQPPSYPPHQFAPAQNFQWPQQGYQPNQPFPQAQNHPGVPGYAPPASNYPGYPAQPAQPAPIYTNQQPYGQAPGWQQHNGQAQYPPNPHYPAQNGPPQPVLQGYDPNATPTPISAHPAVLLPPQAQHLAPSTTAGSFSGENTSLYSASDDWDFDFEGAIWPKTNEPVDPALSLGVIIWHPAKQVTRALPSTFDEAEEQALKPTPEKLENGESVSKYFMADNSHEAFLDVRQTDEWESIQDDPIFVVFTDEAMRGNMVSLEDCIAQRDRLDEHSYHSMGAGGDTDHEMPDVTWSVMDHLEQVLSATNGGPSQPKPTQGMLMSHAGPSQEDILAQLGVTGAPKPPSDEPISLPFAGPDELPSVARHEKPAILPTSVSPSNHRTRTNVSSMLADMHRPPQRVQSFGEQRHNEHTRAPQRPHGSMSSGKTGHFPIPPPPPPPEYPRYGVWNQPQYNGQGYDGSKGSPAPSEGSNHTMAGSDFEPEKPNSSNENGPENPELPASLQRSDSSFSRKRSYEDADHGDGTPRQQDDWTKRKRRSQVDAAYR